MVPSETTKLLNTIQSTYNATLKPLGFVRHGRTFHRKTVEGIVQVINLQAGTNDPAPNFLSVNLKGFFAINLGIYIPQIAQATQHHILSEYPSEYECHIRTRVCTDRQTDWWLINPVTAVDIKIQLEKALSFLNRFETYRQILEYTESAPERIGIGSLPTSSIRAILLQQ